MPRRPGLPLRFPQCSGFAARSGMQAGPTVRAAQHMMRLTHAEALCIKSAWVEAVDWTAAVQCRDVQLEIAH